MSGQESLICASSDRKTGIHFCGTRASSSFETAALRPPQDDGFSIKTSRFTARSRRLGDQFNRRDHDLAAGDLPGLFRIVLEEIALLERLDGLLVGGRGEMIIARIVAVLHAAVGDLALHLGVVVERGNEPADFPMPVLRGAVGKLIFDHEMLHRWLPGCSHRHRSDLWRRRFAPEYRGVAPGKFVKRSRRPPKQHSGVGPYL